MQLSNCPCTCTWLWYLSLLCSSRGGAEVKNKLFVTAPLSRKMHIPQLACMVYFCRCWCEASRSHAHMRLTTLPSSADGAICRRFTFFSQSLACLGYPRSGCQIQSPKSAQAHILQQVLITSMKGNSNNTHRYCMTTKKLIRFHMREWT
jgi:hypothetical protein